MTTQNETLTQEQAPVSGDGWSDTTEVARASTMSTNGSDGRTLEKWSRGHTDNYILGSLPQDDLNAVLPHLRHGRVERDQEVYAPGAPIRELYFPVSGLVSMVATLRSGRSIEVGTVSREGVTGLPVYPNAKNPPYRVGGQISGEGYFLAVDRYLELYAKSAGFRGAIDRYLHVMMTIMSQTAACNGAHDVVQRLAKWLLVAADASDGPEFALTQEYLAIMIGVQRPTVTLAAGELQRAGLVSYRRGKIRLHDRDEILKRACECYETIRTETAALLRTPTTAAHQAA